MELARKKQQQTGPFNAFGRNLTQYTNRRTIFKKIKIKQLTCSVAEFNEK